MNIRLYILRILGVLLIGTLTLTTTKAAELLSGETGASSQWGSGWLDLDRPTDFKSGNKLRLIIGGTAKNIKVRLLPKGRSPDTRAGMLGGVVAVPESRTVEVELQSDRPQVVQISVHGGPNPWGKYPLGGGNGPATLDSAELIRP
jgi:hypothetical protein